METTDLIQRLYQHHEDYAQGHTQSLFNITCDCREAANEIVKLQAFADNGQSAIDTNRRFAVRITQLKAELDTALKAIHELALNNKNTCQYCKHNVPCRSEDCECFIEGVGMTDDKGNYFNTKWTCMDFHYGECPMLENTPCNECVQNGFKNFEWRGF